MQMLLKRSPFLLVLVLLIVVVAACGGGAPDVPSDTEGNGAAGEVGAPPTADPADQPAAEEPAAEEPAPEEPAAEEPAPEEPAPEEPAPEEPAAEEPAAEEPAAEEPAAEEPAAEEPAAEEPAAEEPAAEEPAAEFTGEIAFIDPIFVEGDISVDGSTIVFPLVDRLYGEFTDEGYLGVMDIERNGTATGLERFCNGEVDVAMASRPINSEEQDLCTTNGHEPLPFIIGNDALTILVHTGNDAVSDATLDELAQLFGNATTWADVNPDWPSEDIMRVVPAEETDSFTVFAEAIFGGDAQALASAASTEMQAEPSAILEGVEAEETAAGFMSYTHYVLEQDRVKLVMVEGMEPETGNVASGEYPLSSPMILYTSESLMQEKPQVAGFINYALLTVNSVIVDQGYFPVTEADMEQSKQYWFEANPQ